MSLFNLLLAMNTSTSSPQPSQAANTVALETAASAMAGVAANAEAHEEASGASMLLDVPAPSVPASDVEIAAPAGDTTPPSGEDTAPETDSLSGISFPVSYRFFAVELISSSCSHS